MCTTHHVWQLHLELEKDDALLPLEEHRATTLMVPYARMQRFLLIQSSRQQSQFPFVKKMCSFGLLTKKVIV
jgi:hypothetical protein